MSLETLCRAGMEARDLSLKDRITLQARVNVMIMNDQPEGRILDYIRAYRREFACDLSATEGIGSRFVDILARMGWVLTLLALVVHNAR